MFKVKPVANPYTIYEGLYRIPIAPLQKDIQAEVRKLNLDCFKTLGLSKSQIALRIEGLFFFHQGLKAESRFSRVLTLAGFSEADVAKLSSPDIFGPAKETSEVWELTTKVADFKAMGHSPHWVSCYSEQYNANRKVQIAEYGAVALLRQMDKDGKLLRRFVIYTRNPNKYYPGELVANIEGEVMVGNPKGLTLVRATNIAKLMLASKATKLTDEEVKSFTWGKKAESVTKEPDTTLKS